MFTKLKRSKTPFCLPNFRTFDIGNLDASLRPVCLDVQGLVLRTLQTRAPTMFREVQRDILLHLIFNIRCQTDMISSRIVITP